jgi:hypothetical protein
MTTKKHPFRFELKELECRFLSQIILTGESAHFKDSCEVNILNQVLNLNITKNLKEIKDEYYSRN